MGYPPDKIYRGRACKTPHKAGKADVLGRESILSNSTISCGSNINVKGFGKRAEFDCTEKDSLFMC